MIVDEIHWQHFDENHSNSNDVSNDFAMQPLATSDQNEVDVDHLMMDEITTVDVVVVVVVMNEENIFGK